MNVFQVEIKKHFNYKVVKGHGRRGRKLNYDLIEWAECLLFFV